MTQQNAFPPESYLLVNDPKDVGTQQDFLLCWRQLAGIVECLDRATCENDQRMAIIRLADYMQAIESDFHRNADMLLATGCREAVVARIVETMTERIAQIRQHVLNWLARYAPQQTQSQLAASSGDYTTCSVESFAQDVINRLTTDTGVTR